MLVLVLASASVFPCGRDNLTRFPRILLKSGMPVTNNYSSQTSLLMDENKFPMVDLTNLPSLILP